MSRTQHPLVIALLLGLSISSFAACQSRLTGQRGDLVFGYDTFRDITNFNKPVAVNAKLRLDVSDVGSDAPVDITDAQTNAPEVLKVTGFVEESLVVYAGRPGAVTLKVTAQRENGERANDHVALRAARADVLTLGHFCTASDLGYYFAGDRVVIGFDLYRASGEPLVGYGYYPIEIDPSDGAQQLPGVNAQDRIVLDLAPTTGKVQLHAADDLAGTPITLARITPGHVNGMYPGPGDLELEARVGEQVLLAFRPRYNNQPVCQARMRTEARSLTPDLCTIVSDPDPFGFVELDAHRFGICQFEVRFPAADNGQGHTQRFTMEIGQYPSDVDDNAAAPPCHLATVHPPNDRTNPAWVYTLPLLALLLQLVLIPPFVLYLRRRD